MIDLPPPHSAASERAILAAVLLEPARISRRWLLIAALAAPFCKETATVRWVGFVGDAVFTEDAIYLVRNVRIRMTVEHDGSGL